MQHHGIVGVFPPEEQETELQTGAILLFLSSVGSLQDGSDGEARGEAGGEVFEGVDHQVDPEGQTGNHSHTRPLLIKAKEHLKPGDQRDSSKTVDTHSFLSRAFSSSLVNRLFSPIYGKKKPTKNKFISACRRLLHRPMFNR